MGHFRKRLWARMRIVVVKGENAFRCLTLSETPLRIPPSRSRHRPLRTAAAVLPPHHRPRCLPPFFPGPTMRWLSSFDRNEMCFTCCVCESTAVVAAVGKLNESKRLISAVRVNVGEGTIYTCIYLTEIWYEFHLFICIYYIRRHIQLRKYM